MQTKPHHPQATVVLKDGTMLLATWSQSFDRQPIPGESTAIPSQLIADLDGYDSQAVVSRVEHQEAQPVRIDLTATCHLESHQRSVIVLNSNRISDTRRAAVETHLRKNLRLPLITWEASHQPDPVVRFHGPGGVGKSLASDIRSGLLDLI